jgi:hypothetical protein
MKSTSRMRELEREMGRAYAEPPVMIIFFPTKLTRFWKGFTMENKRSRRNSPTLNSNQYHHILFYKMQPGAM